MLMRPTPLYGERPKDHRTRHWSIIEGSVIAYKGKAVGKADYALSYDDLRPDPVEVYIEESNKWYTVLLYHNGYIMDVWEKGHSHLFD